ncbi:MAG: acyl carrier protein [Rubrivivax sp.]|nr:acyl carrier protein [Rubrivivax sp.]
MNLQEALRWIAGIFDTPADRLGPDTASSEIAGWDSLGVLMLIADLDEKFGIQLDERELYGINGVRSILDLLERAGVLVMADAA